MSVNTGHVSWFKLAQRYKTNKATKGTNINCIHAFFNVAMSRDLRKDLKQDMNKNSNVNDINLNTNNNYYHKQSCIEKNPKTNTKKDFMLIVDTIQKLLHYNVLIRYASVYEILKEIDCNKIQSNIEQEITQIVDNNLDSPVETFKSVLNLFGCTLEPITQEQLQTLKNQGTALNTDLNPKQPIQYYNVVKLNSKHQS